jgi:hypothetical protein
MHKSKTTAAAGKFSSMKSPEKEDDEEEEYDEDFESLSKS